MPYEQQAKDAPAKPAPTPDAQPKRTGTDKAGYDAQKDAVKPKKTGTDKPTFDMFALSDEAKALFVELRGADKKRTEAIMKELTGTQKVPKKLVEAVLEANKPWYGTTWGAIKGGSWHTVGTDKDGNITHEFKLDSKGLGWENVGHKVVADVKKKSVEYQNKKGEWGVKAGYDKRGTVDVNKGNKKDGLHNVHVEGGGDGGALGYKHTKGDETHEGKAGVTAKDGNTAATGSYTHTKGKDSETYTGGVTVAKDKTLDVKAGYNEKNADGSALGVDGNYQKKGDDNTIGGTVKTTDKDGTTDTITGKTVVGGATTRVQGGYTTVETKGDNKGDKTAISGGGSVGEKSGGDASLELQRKGYGLTSSVDAYKTEKDGTTTTNVGGKGALTLKPRTTKDKDGKEKVEGKPVTVNIEARVKNTDKQGGDSTTNTTLGGGIKAGGTAANVKYEGERGSTGGGYQVDKITTDFKQSFDLDKETKEKLSLGLGGYLRLTDKTDEMSTYRGTLTGDWSKGKGDGLREFNFKLQGGHEKMADWSKLTHAHSSQLGDDKGYGHFGAASLGYGHGKHKLALDGALGKTDNTTVGGGHLGYKYGDKHEADFFASVAEQNGEMSTYLKLTSKFSLTDGLSLSSGGFYLAKPGTPEHDQLWGIHAGLGIALKKDMDLTLKMGVAGNGKTIYYVPEAMYNWKDKVGVGVIGNIGSDGTYGVGGKVNIPKANLSIIGGYGSMDMLNNPYMGNAGMKLGPGTGADYMGTGQPAGGFIGVQWNALPTIKKVLGIK